MRKNTNNHLKVTSITTSSKLGDKLKKKSSDLETNRSNLKLTETSMIDKRKNFDIKSNASGLMHGKSSVISENINESFDNNRLYQKLDKIVEKYSLMKDLKETIDNQECETKLLSLLSETEKIVNSNQITSPKEEGGKYEYVEKALLDKLKKDNEDLKKKTAAVVEQLNELNKAFKKVEGEDNFLRQLYNYQQKEKEENESKIGSLETNIEYFASNNERLKEDIRDAKLEKDNIYRTLTTFIGKIDERYAQEMKDLIASYNNQYFLTKHKPKDEGRVEILLGQVCALDKKLSQVNYELACLKKLQVDEKKKQVNPKERESVHH